MAKKKEMDQLTKDCIAARKAGLSYGKWKALQAPQKPKKEKEKHSDKFCRVCGAMIPKTSKRMAFCSYDCQRNYDYHANRTRLYVGGEDDGKI